MAMGIVLKVKFACMKHLPAFAIVTRIATLPACAQSASHQSTVIASLVAPLKRNAMTMTSARLTNAKTGGARTSPFLDVAGAKGTTMAMASSISVTLLTAMTMTRTPSLAQKRYAMARTMTAMARLTKMVASPA
jgi:hypothetical protein